MWHDLRGRNAQFVQNRMSSKNTSLSAGAHFADFLAKRRLRR
jgi:hypothetical protein